MTIEENHTVDYTYTSDGLRTRKYEYNGNEYYYYDHSYVLDGSKILKETILYSSAFNGNSTTTLEYYYDESGISSFRYNGTYYYYLKNLQDDVIGIIDNTGAVVVEYAYDAWGNILSITGELASTVGQYNPFRYRGYYYDSETGLYYLNSRYYDAEVGRFINADGIVGANGGLQGYNMFTYCNNNPITYTDSSGYVAKNVITRDDGFGNSGAKKQKSENSVLAATNNKRRMSINSGFIIVAKSEAFSIEAHGDYQFKLNLPDDSFLILNANSTGLLPVDSPANVTLETTITPRGYKYTVIWNSYFRYTIEYIPRSVSVIQAGGGPGPSSEDIESLSSLFGSGGIPKSLFEDCDPEAIWKILASEYGKRS